MAGQPRKRSRFKTGMFLLENITSGMYNDPLAILREYIQNSVDSIDLAHQGSMASSAEIKIDLNPFEKRIVIRDNGQGIPSAFAEEVLCSIGSSNKAGHQLRGFRGIGRLGGIAFSDRAVFRTKAEGEAIESVQEWDCISLRKIIGERQKKRFSLSQVLGRITSFSSENKKEKKGSYFEVTLEGVSSFRDYLFDITRVERFLSQAAPVPFDPDLFRFADAVEKHLENNLSHYRRYNLLLNGKPIFKPYKDYVRVTKGGLDRLVGIQFFDIKEPKGEIIGVGWFGKREELLGSITRGDDCSGIRVRSGNIMIGDNHLLDGCFREARFNSYIPGEIHIESSELIPNSRRDDFVDNKFKSYFYNGVEKEIGLQISKEIRLSSRKQSQLRIVTPDSKSKREASVNNAKDAHAGDVLQKLLIHCKECPKLQSIIKSFPDD
ncbi:MAG: hypothetical protein C4575_07355 [Desulforudis sp.]|jgi:molecular chaperone HtpG|nr:MAG: hypothetical protein C4575_07355 [Desulforudis sp.]